MVVRWCIELWSSALSRFHSTGRTDFKVFEYDFDALELSKIIKKDSKILVLGGLGEGWSNPTAVTNDPNSQGDDYETMPSEIFDINTGVSTRVGNSETWKRKDGAHPKDYLFPLMIPSDTLYCKGN